MSNSTVQLTEHMEITSGSHITYFYTDFQCYLDNVTSLFFQGIELNQHIIVIESITNISLISSKIKQHLTEDNWRHLHFFDNMLFYESEFSFQCHRIVQNFEKTVTPFLENRIPIRIWGQAAWKKQDDLYKEILEYECTCDEEIESWAFYSLHLQCCRNKRFNYDCCIKNT